jgi:leader peptidase (prepilin peptidase)/N-methyltransferase
MATDGQADQTPPAPNDPAQADRADELPAEADRADEHPADEDPADGVRPDSLDVTISGPAIRALIVAATTAGVAAVGWAHRDDLLVAALLLPVVIAYGVLSIIDAAEQRLPNNITLPLAAASAVIVVVAGVVAGSVGRGLIAVGVGLAFAVVLFVLRFGMGDVKLALTVGTVAGWFGANTVITTMLASALSGAVAAMVLLAIYRRRNVYFSYGPFLAIGSTIGMIYAGG